MLHSERNKCRKRIQLSFAFDSWEKKTSSGTGITYIKEELKHTQTTTTERNTRWELISWCKQRSIQFWVKNQNKTSKTSWIREVTCFILADVIKTKEKHDVKYRNIYHAYSVHFLGDTFYFSIGPRLTFENMKSTVMKRNDTHGFRCIAFNTTSLRSLISKFRVVDIWLSITFPNL